MSKQGVFSNMSINRPATKVAVFLTLVMSLVFTTSIAVASEASSVPSRTAVISDTNLPGDTLTITMEQVAAQEAGKQLEGWLISDDGSTLLNVGILSIESGNVSHTYVSSAGENLIAGYNKFVITVEPSGVPDAESSGVYAYSHRVPLDVITHVRHLLVEWPSGSESGVITDLQSSISSALAHVNKAMDASTLDDVISNANSAKDAISSVLTNSASLDHAAYAAAEAPSDDTVAENAANVAAVQANINSWAAAASDQIDVATSKTTAQSAKIQLTSVKGYLESAQSGVDANADGTITASADEGGADQAYTAAQAIATYTLSEGELSAAGGDLGLGLPATGDASLSYLLSSHMMSLALIFASLMIVGGGMLVVRTRRIN